MTDHSIGMGKQQWRATTMNLEKIKQLAADYTQLTSEQKTKVTPQVDEIIARLNNEPKPFGWRIRERVGDHIKWYKEAGKV